MHQNFYRLLILLSGLFLASCEFSTEVTAPESRAEIADLVIPPGFDFKTTRLVTLTVNVATYKGMASFGVYDEDGKLLLNAAASQSQPFITEIELPAWQDTLFVRPKRAGLPDNFTAVAGIQQAQVTIAPPPASKSGKAGGRTNGITRKSALPNGLQTLGGWDNNGRPDYLEQPDVIEQSLLDDIDASLPESRPVPEYNQSYLVDSDMNTRLQETAEIWVTFVHEGAGWTNSLGFYTYNLDNPPATKDDIEDLYIIFPNTSYQGSGGNLNSGDKVSLGVYPANTGIGWFLIPNGWNRNEQTVKTSNQTKYSVKKFNDYTAAEFSQHAILLKDEKRELLLLGFEDTTRPAGDNDFNDAIFYVTSNPFSAVIRDDLQAITENKDSDGDGVPDHLDDYPQDGAQTYTAYIPADKTTGTLAFEDLWPAQGDYDFNDLVVDYNYELRLNASRRISEVRMKFTLLAIGASYRNGFAVELPVPASTVTAVTGNQLHNRYVNIAPNGTEAGQPNAVIVLFEDAFEVMAPVAGEMVNATENGSKTEPVEIEIIVNFVPDMVNEGALSISSLNPFVVVNGNRGHEIHLPGYQPTQLADSSLFGQGNDASHTGASNRYLSPDRLPWALNLSRPFYHPLEGVQITKAYLKFAEWAQSGGVQSREWYQKSGNPYRNENLIFRR